MTFQDADAKVASCVCAFNLAGHSRMQGAYGKYRQTRAKYDD